MNKSRILYVDDEHSNRLLFEINMKKHFPVVTAESGYEALEILAKSDDILFVFSDFKMPGMNGLELIKTAKEKYPQLAYYIVTGFFITPELAEARNDGVYEQYFVKPYKVKDLLRAIDDRLNAVN